MFVGLRILIVSRGNSDTLRSLVQNLNVTAIVLATILPFVSTGFVLLFVFCLLSAFSQWRTRNDPPEAAGNKEANFKSNLALAVLVLPFVFVLGWYATPIRYAMV